MASESVTEKGDDFTSRTTFHSGYRLNTLKELCDFGQSIANECALPSSFAYGQIAMCGPDTTPACPTPVIGWFGASHRPQSTLGKLQYGNIQPGNLLCERTEAEEVLEAFNNSQDTQLNDLKEQLHKIHLEKVDQQNNEEPVVVNAKEDLVRILRMPDEEVQQEQSRIIDDYRNRRTVDEAPEHPLVPLLAEMAEGCPAASFVVGVIPDVRTPKPAQRSPILVPIAFYTTRSDANSLLAAIRERVPRLTMTLYVLPPAQLYDITRLDEGTEAMHSATPEVDKVMTETRATDARTADMIHQTGLRKLVSGQLANRLLQECEETDVARKTEQVLLAFKQEVGDNEVCERHACAFLGLTKQETDTWLADGVLADSFVDRVRKEIE